MGVFNRAKLFSADNILQAPGKPGIYIIYKDHKPFYVGRSLSSVRGRLQEHFRHSGKGSSKIRKAMQKKSHLTFEAEALNNAAQAERFLIMALGTKDRGNLRYEYSDEDWCDD